MKVETIAEQLLFATLRIVVPRSNGDASIGTGFIVSHRWAEDKKGSFLVTNKHVIQHTTQGRLAFTLVDASSKGSAPSLGSSTSIDLAQSAWQWTGHPSSEIDIAALPLAPAVRHLTQRGEAPFYKSIPTSMTPNQEDLDGLDAIEEILFVGYPSGIYDRTNNLPIMRQGITATPPTIDHEGKPIFLIDASVFPGSSGSPVLLYSRGPWPTKSGSVKAGPRFLFLGILGSAFFREDDGSFKLEEIPTAVRPVVKTTQMIDLGVVYKARTVVETIEHLLSQRGELPANTAVALVP